MSRFLTNSNHIVDYETELVKKNLFLYLFKAGLELTPDNTESEVIQDIQSPRAES